MKKFLLIFALFFSISSALADDAADWQNVYSQIKTAYINEITIAQLASASLKNISAVDPKLRVADDNTRITLYYQGKVIKVLRKPNDPNDAKTYGDIAAKIIFAAESASPKADEKSFKITDELAKGILKVLDDNSEFYSSMDEAEGIVKRNKRHWSSRLLDDGVLYVKITAFNKQTFNELTNAIAEYPQAEKLIIDIRNCPGGMASEAIKTSDLFLSEGIIASTSEKDEFSQVYYSADSDEIFKNKPIEIWTDSQTASAAEILAAALQEQSRAIIKGQKTYGKGTLQKLIILPSNSVLAVTSGYFHTPSGQKLHHRGVIPNIEEENLTQF